MASRRYQDEIERLRTITNLRSTNFPSDAQWMQFLSSAVKSLQDRILSINPKICQTFTYKFGVIDERETYPLPVSVSRVIDSYWEPTIVSTAFPNRVPIRSIDGYDTDAQNGASNWAERQFFIKENWPNKQYALSPPPKAGIPSAVTVVYVPKLPELHFGSAPAWTSTSLTLDNSATGLLLRSVNDYRDCILRVTDVSTGAVGRGAFARVTSSDPDTLILNFTAGWRRENNQGSTSGLTIPTGSTLGYQIEAPIEESWMLAALNETAKAALGKDADAQMRIPLIDTTYPLTVQSLLNSVEEQSPVANVVTRDVYSSWPSGGY